MPIERANLDGCQAVLSQVGAAIDAAAEAVAGESEALHKLSDLNDFSAKRDMALETTGAAISRLVDLCEGLKTAGLSVRSTAAQVLENYARDDYPVTQEGISKLTDQAIRCDSLVQPLYLDPYLFASAVRSASVDLSPNTVPMPSIARQNPEDMYAQSILTRTSLYLKQLREKEEDEWFYGAMGALGETANYLQEYINDLMNIREAIDAEAFKELAIRTMDNPATEEAFVNSVNSMEARSHAVSTMLGSLRGIHSFFVEVLDALRKTETSILDAYAIYIAAQHITF